MAEFSQSEMHYRALFEAANDAILVCRNGRIEDCNPRAQQLFAASPRELLGKSIEELSPELQPDGRNSLEKARQLGQRILAGESMLVEWTCFRLDGKLFDAELSISATVVGGDCVVQCLVRDISERKREQQALKHSEERFEKAFRLSPEPMSIHSIDGRYVDINDVALGMFGLNRAEVIGHTAEELGIAIEPTAKLLNEFGANSSLRNRETEVRSRSGSILTVLLSAELIRIGDKPHILVMAPDITDRKCAECALRQSEERFKKTFQLSPIPMVISRLRGEIVAVNETALQSFGYTLHDALGRTADEVGISVEPALTLRDEFRRCGMKLHNRETQFRTRSGEVRTLLLSAELIYLQGKPHMLWMGPDITERKASEEALLQSEERFKKTFRASPIPMVIARVVGGIVDINDTALQILGLRLEEALGRTADEIGISVEPAVRVREELRASGWKVRNRETQYRARSGEIRTLLLSAELIQLQGEPHALVMGPDITEQKRQQESMRMLSSAVTAASDAIIVTDNDLSPTPTVLYANPAFTRLTGYTSEELIGRRTHETFGARIDSETAANIQQILRSGREFHGEITNYTKDGRCLNLELDIVPVLDSTGRVTNFVAVRRDISLRKAAELNRQRLLHLVIEAQTEERRRISRELHDHAGQLLTSMLLRLEALQQGTQALAAKHAIKEISSVASSALEDLSRIARGLHPAVLDDLGLIEALRRALDEFESAGISTQFVISGMKDRLPQNVEHEMYQILKEGLTNVRKHSQARHVALSVDRQGGAIAALLADDGVGFDDTASGAARTGLGVVGMNERAALLGGSLTVHSRPHAGTVVSVKIPLPESLEAMSRP